MSAHTGRVFNASARFRASPWPGLVSIAAAFVFMAWLSWRKWPDLLIDFGNQLYIPWQLSQGQVLYRDIAYLPGGPLSQYFNALLFKLFGASLNVLIAANLILLTLTLALVYRGFQRASNSATAALIVLSIIFGFAFSQYLDVGNYNYICPYSHEAVHGLFLSILLIALLARWLRLGTRLALVSAGFCFGLIFLTKAEIFLAAGMAVMVAFWWARKFEANRALHNLRWSMALFCLSAMLPSLGFFWYFRSHGDASFSFRSVVAAWTPLLTTNVSRTNFYQSWMGLEQPITHLKVMFTQFLVLVASLLFCAWRFRVNPTSVERIILFSLAGATPLLMDWTECGRALPLLALTALLAVVWNSKKNNQPNAEDSSFALLWLWFSLFLLAKLGLYARVVHYGFVLAMPAFVGAVYFLYWLLPPWLETRGVNKKLFQSAIFIFLLAAFFRFVAQSQLVYREKTFPVGSAQDRMMAAAPAFSETTAIAAAAQKWIEANTRPPDTLAVLPEGAMLNYLCRRRNSTPYLVFMAEVSAFGEETMFAAYRKNPPDYIALLHRDSSEYGPRFFGQEKGYGREMLLWMEANYETVFLAGHEPLQTADFGVKIFQKRRL